MALEKRLEEGSRVKVTVLGWGTMREGGRPAKELRWVEVPYVSHEECKRAMRPHKIYESMTCAGYIRQGGKDACQGDSGGGLLHQGSGDQGAWTQEGIVSAGIGCARRGVPGLYTRVTSYLDWIQEHRRQQEHLLKL